MTAVDERRRQALAILGDDALACGQPTFRPVLVAQLQRLFDDVVLPVVRVVWPDVDNATFLAKWRGGAELYAALGTSLLATSTKRSRWIARACDVVDSANVDDAGVVAAARIAVPLLFGVLERERCERVALCAAWIVVLDEVLDETLADAPAAVRRRMMHGIVRGQAPSSSPPAALAAAALARAIRRRCRGDADADGLRALQVAADRWVDGEIQSFKGDDPGGDQWRRAGATASMDMVLWALGDAVADEERRLLYAVAELGQRVDDWLDIESDAAQGRRTPAISGFWRPDEIAPLLAHAEACLRRLADQVATPADGVVRRLLVRTFRAELQRLVGILVAQP